MEVIVIKRMYLGQLDIEHHSETKITLGAKVELKYGILDVAKVN